MSEVYVEKSLVPLGRGNTVSTVIATETAKQKQLVADYLAMPPVNNNNSARQLRSMLVKHQPSLTKTFEELKLDYDNT